MSLVESTLALVNDESGVLESVGADRGEQAVGLHISGTFVGTVTILRSLDEGVTFGALATTYTGAIETTLAAVRGAQYKAKFSARTSGSVIIKLRS